MLVIVVAIALLIQNRILSAGNYDIIKGKSMRPTLIKLRAAKYPLLFLSIFTLFLIVIVPLAMIILISFVKAYGWHENGTQKYVNCVFDLDEVNSKTFIDAVEKAANLSLMSLYRSFNVLSK